MYRATSQVATYRPDGTGQQFLGRLGHVGALRYSDTMPGGNDQLSCALQMNPAVRTDAMDPGRIVRVHRGGSVVWDGKLDEPQPGETGWQITAHGAGTYGTEFRAVYTTWAAEEFVDQAIARGLRWKRIQALGDGHTYPRFDSGSKTVTEFLNDYLSPVGKTWHVGRNNVLTNFLIPTTVTRLLIATIPATRTLAGYINALYARYQATADSTGTKNATPATYGLASAANTASIGRHQRSEQFWDLSSAGVMSAANAGASAATALAKYTAASYAGPFTVRHGQYLTTSGAPVDLGCEQAGEVVRLIMADGSFGGEVAPSPPITFAVGKIDYDDLSDTAEITPFQTVGTDLSSLLTALTPAPPAAA